MYFLQDVFTGKSSDKNEAFLVRSNLPCKKHTVR